MEDVILDAMYYTSFTPDQIRLMTIPQLGRSVDGFRDRYENAEFGARQLYVLVNNFINGTQIRDIRTLSSLWPLYRDRHIKVPTDADLYERFKEFRKKKNIE